MVAWKPWKSAEKEVAKCLGGMRRVRISYSETIGDIIHDKYSIEVKYGKQVPKYLRVKDYTVLIHDGMRYDLTPIGVPCSGDVTYHRPKSITFLHRAFAQAVRYNPTKQPVVCVKAPRMHGFVMVTREKLYGLHEAKKISHKKIKRQRVNFPTG